MLFSKRDGGRRGGEVEIVEEDGGKVCLDIYRDVKCVDSPSRSLGAIPRCNIAINENKCQPARTVMTYLRISHTKSSHCASLGSSLSFIPCARRTSCTVVAS